jgi:hypothetical protein
MRLTGFIAAGLLAAATAAQAGTNVGVSIGINQPGVYGRIDIGNVPQPALIVTHPVVIAPSPVAVYQRPIYMVVPPGHQRNWSRHCHAYGACAQPVYFVKESWAREHRAHGHRGKGHGKHREGRGRGHGRHDD